MHCWDSNFWWWVCVGRGDGGRHFKSKKNLHHCQQLVLSDFCHTNKCVTISHCCLNLNFSNDNIEHLLISIIFIIHCILWSVLKPFAHFVKLCCLLPYVWVLEALNIFWLMNPLTGRWFTNHFIVFCQSLRSQCVFQSKRFNFDKVRLPFFTFSGITHFDFVVKMDLHLCSSKFAALLSETKACVS